MADEILQAELLAACSALGYSDGNKYYQDPDCLETIKDLIRYLRRDDESHEIRRALGETRVVQTDLIPILKESSSEQEIFDVNLRLLVNLTNPVILLFREELPEEKVTRQQYLQLISHQQAYKEKFADEKLWKVLVKTLEKCLMKEWTDRQEEDNLIIERILILIRNVLSVPSNPQEEQRTDDDASLHDQVIWSLHLANFEVVLQYISSSEQERDLAMHALEIISLMLREQDPEILAKTQLTRSHSEKTEDENALSKLLEKEKIAKLEKMKKMQSKRHSRFGGTYCIANMKSISDREIISHQPVSNIKDLNFDKSKKPKKIAKNRAPLTNTEISRRSTLAIRVFLQSICVEFLNGSYNRIMQIVKDNISNGKSQENDETYYLWAMKFFMAFNRNHNFKIELVSETISAQSFHYIQQQLENYYEMIATDKKKYKIWSRRMHKALRAYQELLLTLVCLDQSPHESEREFSKVIKCKVFYVVEYRDFLLILLQNFDEVKMSKDYLKDVVEANHVLLKLLEMLCSKTKHLMVQGKAKMKRTKKSKKRTELPIEENLEDKWSQISDELSALIQGPSSSLPQTIPFDPLSEDTDDEQKEKAMKRVNYLLRKKTLDEALSLFRSSREVWPEGEIFGSADMDSTDEFMSLRTVFFADINPPEMFQQPPSNDYDEEDEEEIEESMPVISEQEFNLIDFIRRYAHIKVIKNYCYLLQSYKTNSPHTNRCILKIFHRIAWDSNLPAMFFQASLFKIFQTALNNPERKKDETLYEISKFGKFIMKKFFLTAAENPKVFVELLFWKNKNDAVEIVCGYDASQNSNTSKKLWSEEEEDELKRLYYENREKLISQPEESDRNKDTVDYIMESMIRQDRTRRAVIIKLKELGFITHTKQLKRKTVNIRTKPWTEDEETELKVLFEEYKDTNDIVGLILLNMMEPKPRQKVINKILELGLVNDRKDLRKKRQATSNKRSSKNDGEKFLEANQENDSDISNSSSNENSDSEDDSERVTHKSRSIRKNNKLNDYNCAVITPSEILKATKKVVDKNIIEPIDWIADLLKETADDREQDQDFEPVPILAISSNCTDALEDEDFQILMKVIGLRPPSDHQEAFWRIPSNISIEGLRKRAQYLIQCLQSDNNDEILNEEMDSNHTGCQNIHKDLSDIKNADLDPNNFDKLLSSNNKLLELEIDKENRSRKVIEPSDSNSNSPVKSSILKDISNKRTFNNNSDSDDSESYSKKSEIRKRRKVVLSDSDEDESVPEVESELVTNNPHIKKGRVLDSDSEEEMPKISSRAAIISDDED